MKRKIINELGYCINEISGIELSILDINMRCLHMSKRRGADYCNVVHSCPKGLDMCKMSDKVNISTVLSTKKSCRFVCPFGIEELIVPIMRDDNVCGLIFASIGVNADKLKDEDVAATAAKELSAIPYETFIKEISLVPHLTEKKVDACVRLVELFAEKIEAEQLIDAEDFSLGAMIKKYVRDNIQKRITLADISYYLHRSTVSITQHFKSEYGITIMQYVTKKRLGIAEKLLRTTDESVKKIAITSGFDEVEYFSRCFKKHYGMTPSEYRNEYKLNGETVK